MIKIFLVNYYLERQEMVLHQKIFMINVIIKELLLYLLKPQKVINLVVILNYNGIVIQAVKKINLLLYFRLIIKKNILLEMIIIQFVVVHPKAPDLDLVTLKFIYMVL